MGAGCAALGVKRSRAASDKRGATHQVSPKHARERPLIVAGRSVNFAAQERGTGSAQCTAPGVKQGRVQQRVSWPQRRRIRNALRARRRLGPNGARAQAQGCPCDHALGEPRSRGRARRPAQGAARAATGRGQRRRTRPAERACSAIAQGGSYCAQSAGIAGNIESFLSVFFFARASAHPPSHTLDASKRGLRGLYGYDQRWGHCAVLARGHCDVA